MDFIGLLKTLDDLVYELMSWLVFYPVTLWQTLRHPLRMMNYADLELKQAEDQQYTDTLSPPIFLLITLLISHGIELALIGQSDVVRSKGGLSAFVTDDASLIMLRLVVFSTFPMVIALRLVRAQHKKLTRDVLRMPFYSQSYVAAPFALAVGIGTVLIEARWAWGVSVGAVIILFALAAYWVVQARWFAQHLRVPLGRGFGVATLALAQSIVIVGLFMTLFR